MNASEFHSGEEAAGRYLTEGLGATFTQNAAVIMSAIANGSLGELRGAAIKFVCGNIAERVLWLDFGVSIGYFDPFPPVSVAERAFLEKHSGSLKDVGMPQQIMRLCERLAHSDKGYGEYFSTGVFSSLRLTRRIPEWFPVFQALLVAQELLNEPAITPFLLFLHQGDPERFRRRDASPDGVFSGLHEENYIRAFSSDFAEPEPVIAGFIRFTEFLSVMDQVFPDIPLATNPESPEVISDRIADRYVMSCFVDQYRWRFPVNAFERYRAVIAVFSEMVVLEFSRHPQMGICWSPDDTYSG